MSSTPNRFLDYRSVIKSPKTLGGLRTRSYSRNRIRKERDTDTTVGILLIVMGSAIAGVWTADIVKGDKIDFSQGFLKASDPEDGSLFLPHWIAEYGTAIGLITGGVGLIVGTDWATLVAALGSGALLYTSMNSLGWALADRSRRAYAVPMMLGVVVGLISAVFLLAG